MKGLSSFILSRLDEFHLLFYHNLNVIALALMVDVGYSFQKMLTNLAMMMRRKVNTPNSGMNLANLSNWVSLKMQLTETACQNFYDLRGICCCKI